MPIVKKLKKIRRTEKHCTLQDAFEKTEYSYAYFAKIVRELKIYPVGLDQDSAYSLPLYLVAKLEKAFVEAARRTAAKHPSAATTEKEESERIAAKEEAGVVVSGVKLTLADFAELERRRAKFLERQGSENGGQTSSTPRAKKNPGRGKGKPS